MLFKSSTNSLKPPQRRFAEAVKGTVKSIHALSTVRKSVRLFNIYRVPFAWCIKKCCYNIVLIALKIINCDQCKEKLN